MDSSIVLYKKRIDLSGCMLGISILVVPVLAAFFTESLVLSLLATSMCVIASVQIDKSNPTETPVLLKVTEEGMAHDTRPVVPWDEISDIQIVDKVLSVSCEQNPEKDFRLNLNGTDIGSHPPDSLENIILQYYHKRLYAYQTPYSCGSCGGCCGG